LCCSLHRFFSTIELNILHFIILGFLHLNQGAIYEPNTPRQFLQLHIEGNFLFRCSPMDFICKCIINSCAWTMHCPTKQNLTNSRWWCCTSSNCQLCHLTRNNWNLLVLIKYKKSTWNIKIALKNLNPNFKTLSPNSKPKNLGWNLKNQTRNLEIRPTNLKFNF